MLLCNCYGFAKIVSGNCLESDTVHTGSLWRPVLLFDEVLSFHIMQKWNVVTRITVVHITLNIILLRISNR